MMRVWRAYLDLFTEMVELNNDHIDQLRLEAEAVSGGHQRDMEALREQCTVCGQSSVRAGCTHAAEPCALIQQERLDDEKRVQATLDQQAHLNSHVEALSNQIEVGSRCDCTCTPCIAAHSSLPP